MALCDKIVIEGRKIGTHFAWHVLNGITLFLLLRASFEDSPDAVRAVAATASEEADGAEPPPESRDVATVLPAPETSERKRCRGGGRDGEGGGRRGGGGRRQRGGRQDFSFRLKGMLHVLC